MEYYESKCLEELKMWQHQMQHNPSLINKISRALQDKINGIIPDKAHQVITVTIQKMVQAVLFGSKYTTSKTLFNLSLLERERLIKSKTENYRNVATTEGVITGAGGILLGLADFPILLGIKIKLLFEIAAIYGHDVKDYRERIYILYLFQIAFSSQKRRQEIYKKLDTWEEYSAHLPEKVEEFDWLVPGLRLELVTEMIRALPKAIRKSVVPAADWAKKILVELQAVGRLTETLAQTIQSMAGVKVARPTASAIAGVPASNL